MQLTERQCWKVIRNLVADKNKEFSDFFKEAFGADWEHNRNLLGYTRDAFLNKFGFYHYNVSNPINEFHDLVKQKGRKPASNWLEDLSTSDLILFLDYRCRTLQSMYNYYKNHNTIDRNVVQQIVDETTIAPISAGNSIEATSKPARVQGETKLSDMHYTKAQFAELALSQILSEMAGKCIANQKFTIKQAEEMASNVLTSNIDLGGRVTGYKRRGEIKAKIVEVSKPVVKPQPKPESSAGTIKLAGYDEKMYAIFTQNGVLVDILGNPIDAVLVYDRDKNPIVYDEPNNSCKFVGLDIQGTPVYEDEDGYYNSLGERLGDVFIDNTQDDMFEL